MRIRGPSVSSRSRLLADHYYLHVWGVCPSITDVFIKVRDIRGFSEYPLSNPLLLLPLTRFLIIPIFPHWPFGQYCTLEILCATTTIADTRHNRTAAAAVIGEPALSSNSDRKTQIRDIIPSVGIDCSRDVPANPNSCAECRNVQSLGSWRALSDWAM